MKPSYRYLIGILVPLIIWALPTSMIPINGLTIVEHRLLVIFLFATLFWILEPIPIYATSLLIIFTELVFASDKGLKILVQSSNPDGFGTLLNYREIMATFASPIIILFLGGFYLGIAATKFRLDINLARIMLKPFGKKPSLVLLGLMFITAFFSMFMSNTATTAMMLAILTPVLASFPKQDRGKRAFVLAIPFAANIGGLGTPIGTPPNAVALKYLTGSMSLSFGKWMSFAFPYVMVLLFIAWFVLIKLYPSSQEKMELEIDGHFIRNLKAYTVYGTFIVTVLLWLTDFIHGMNAYIVAMIPVAVFSATRILTTQDLKKINWDVLWLVSGGIALGYGLEKTGLASRVIEQIPFSHFPALWIIVLAALTTWGMASVMSHTATANLLLPMIAVLGASLPGLVPFGGTMMLILVVTMTCSLSMPLPISTPPNAMAHATGQIVTRDMTKSGLVIGFIGILGVFLLMMLLQHLRFFQ